MIEREKEPFTIVRLIDELRARCDLSRKANSRFFDTALVASGMRQGERGRAGTIINNTRKNRVPVVVMIWLAVLPHLENKVVRFPAAFARKQGTCG